MKEKKWQISLGLSLVFTSVLLYFIHYLIFKDPHHIFIYLLGDIAFLPVEVLLVTIILHELLSYREKQALLNKMNMVIGAFFSEVGNELLKKLINFDGNFEKIRGNFVLSNSWKAKNFEEAKSALREIKFKIVAQRGNLNELKDFLIVKREFLLRLLENPILLEHESFTNLLWAVFHLTEELAARPTLSNLPPSDYEHLSGDIQRAYVFILYEWIGYTKHLSVSYPFLYSLVVRTNPFLPEVSPIVRTP